MWATALYAGLRRGELIALRWEDVDLGRGLIRVERSWDVRAGVIGPKSRAGRRKVPIAAVLRDYLDEHKLATERSEGLVFGRTESRPFEPVSAAARAASAWKAENAKGQENDLDALAPITLHEARHVRRADDRRRREREGAHQQHAVCSGSVRHLRPARHRAQRTPARLNHAGNGKRSGAGVEPTQPGATRPHRF